MRVSIFSSALYPGAASGVEVIIVFGLRLVRRETDLRSHCWMAFTSASQEAACGAAEIGRVIARRTDGTKIDERMSSYAMGYLSGTVNAHIDADLELHGRGFARSPEGAPAAVFEHLPPDSRGQNFLNRTRGSGISTLRISRGSLRAGPAPPGPDQVRRAAVDGPPPLVEAQDVASIGLAVDKSEGIEVPDDVIHSA